jgi:hypothetical protein
MAIVLTLTAWVIFDVLKRVGTINTYLYFLLSEFLHLSTMRPAFLVIMNIHHIHVEYF